MKTLILVCTFLITTLSFAQNKNARVSFEVDGVCNMCKSRIEKASLKTPGVKSAIWDVQSHELKLIIDERKTDVKTIQQSIADAGHDTKEVVASDEAYHSLHSCCLYRDDAVIDDHKE